MIRIRFEPVTRNPWMWQGSYPASYWQYLLTASHRIQIFLHRPWNVRLLLRNWKQKIPAQSRKISEKSSELGKSVWKCRRSLYIGQALLPNCIILLTLTSIFESYYTGLFVLADLVWPFHDLEDIELPMSVSNYRNVFV